ncbi:50S ribosomal protein L9 [Butyrivibrio sp. NC2002]|uniref:50S ribosomal protein L9 n=1 Tax=Butyrivibrio sp. NC2002 TaxID=1410610 RepID=UPI000565FCC3|nr:50S ribosomal protein L9 [Butyrivibrio sp. NC2002]
MEVILLEDVKSLGKKGDVVKVSDGYASNFILPKKLGVEANKANLNNLKNQKKRDEKEAQELLESMQEFAKEIEKVTVRVTMKAGEGGRVFGSVSSKEIATEAKKQFNITLDKKKIQLPEPIRTFGTTEIPVKLHPQVTATLKVAVTEA